MGFFLRTVIARVVVLSITVHCVRASKISNNKNIFFIKKIKDNSLFFALLGLFSCSCADSL